MGGNFAHWVSHWQGPNLAAILLGNSRAAFALASEEDAKEGVCAHQGFI